MHADSFSYGTFTTNLLLEYVKALGLEDRLHEYSLGTGAKHRAIEAGVSPKKGKDSHKGAYKYPREYVLITRELPVAEAGDTIVDKDALEVMEDRIAPSYENEPVE